MKANVGSGIPPKEALMRMRRYSVRGLLLAALVFLMGLGHCAAAEDMQFVDADGDTGYYVDTLSIVRVSEAERDAVVAVVKAAENRRYLYRMRFDAGGNLRHEGSPAHRPRHRRAAALYARLAHAEHCRLHRGISDGRKTNGKVGG